ncbi:MFS general substrate transporter [Calocera cornea HHB12733]|uniref:MFS general substrate transporter n=1 Tax=Calocera cornea HHB12733 TaxID=1353952 RepID=A0A165JTY4_9BASI|nr:MFS general substrate transporter [Calocera cornea HHB12733]
MDNEKAAMARAENGAGTQQPSGFAQWCADLKPKPTNASNDITASLAALRSVTLLQWAMFFSGFIAWTIDAIDFFSVSLSVTALTKQFNRSTNDITTSITLTLLFRSVGALVFGMLSDRYGRKWPLIANLILCTIFSLCTAFALNYGAFLGVRCLFGIAMGGIWGLSAATALENLPVQVRGLASGVLQEGYAVGYLIAAVINLTLVSYDPFGWRALFWVAAGISAFAAVVRLCLPESQVFLRAKEDKRIKAAEGHEVHSKSKVFLRETRAMLRQHWLRCIYAVLLMTGFNFLSHGSQDLYPTYLQQTKGFTAHNANIATIIGNCGAVAGGIFAGILSQFIGRRLTIVIFTLSIGAFIPLWILPSGFSPLAAGAFCVQFGVQGAWGVIPIHLAEISPPAFRATFPGVAYQLGNMVSSASAQIEATGGEHQRTILNGQDAPDYAKVQGIFLGVVAAFVIFMTLIGAENHSSEFEKHKLGFELGGGQDEAVDESATAGSVTPTRGEGSAEKAAQAQPSAVHRESV